MEILEACPHIDKGGDQNAKVKDVVTMAKYVSLSLEPSLRNFHDVAKGPDYIKLSTTQEWPQGPLVYLTLFHEVSGMEAARLS